METVFTNNIHDNFLVFLVMKTSENMSWLLALHKSLDNGRQMKEIATLQVFDFEFVWVLLKFDQKVQFFLNLLCQLCNAWNVSELS